MEEINKEDLEQLVLQIIRSTNIKQKTFISQLLKHLQNNEKLQTDFLEMLIKAMNCNNYFDLKIKIRILELLLRIIKFKKELKVDEKLIYETCKACLNMLENQIRIDCLGKLSKNEQKFMKYQNKILSLVPQNYLEELIKLNENNNERLCYLIYLLKDNKNIEQLLKGIMEKKIISECLLEKTQRTQTSLKYIAIFNKFIDQEFFNNEMYPLISKGLRRSENNIEILNLLFEQQFSVDFSKYAEEIIFQILKDYLLNSKIQTIISYAVKQIIIKIKDATTIEKIMNMFIGLIDKTIEENSKIKLFQMFGGFNSCLKNLPTLQLQLQNFYLLNIALIVQEENVEIFNDIISDFVKQSENLILTEKQLTSLKKFLGSTNKGTVLVVSNLILSFLKKYGKETNIECLKTLIPTANQSLVVNQLKSSQKLVTNYQILLVGLNLCSLSQNLEVQCLKDNTLNYQQMFNQLLSDIFVNQQKFFQKANQNEIDNYTSALIQFSNKLSTLVKPGDKKYLILAHTLIQCLFHSQSKLSQILQLINEFVDRNYILQLLVFGLFVKVYFFELSDYKEAEKFRKIVQFIIKHFGLINFEEINLFALIWVVYHPSCNLKILHSKKFLKQIKQLNLFDKMKEALQKQKDNLYYYFVSPVESVGEINFYIRHHCFKCLIDFDILDLLENYKMFINSANFGEEAFVGEFEKDLESKTQYCFDQFYAIEEYLLQFWFITKKQFNFEAIIKSQQKQQQAQGGKGKKGGVQQQKGKEKQKEKEKQVIMDEEEIALMKQNQLLEKMTYYFSIVIQYYELLVTSTPQHKEHFFNNYYSLLMELADTKSVRGLIVNVLVKYFKSKQLCKDFALSLVEQVLRKYECINNELYPIEEDVEQQLKQFFAKLLVSWNENEQVYIIDQYNEISQFIIENQDFCLHVKEQAMQVLFQIIKFDKIGKFKEQIFDLVVNHINRICYFEKFQNFLDFLLSRLDLTNDKYLKNLFNEILNICETGQQIILTSLNKLPEMQKNNEKKIKFSFEIFIKLKILQENPDGSEPIIKLCNALLNNQGEIVFNSTEIQNFSLGQFFKSTSKDETELFSKLCSGLFKDHQEQSELMMQNVIDLCSEIVEEDFNEESVQFFPDYFLQNINKINKKFFKPIYSLIIEKCCNNEDDQTLIQLCMKLGIQIIKIYGDQYGKELTDIIDFYLENETKGINKSVAVVLIGVCAPFIQDKSKLGNIQKKIIGLFETGSEALQKNLSKCVIDLMIFFENPEEIVRRNLVALELNDIQIQRGAAYLIAGLIQGLGVIYLEKYSILAQIDQMMQKKEKDKNAKAISIGVLYLMLALMDNLGKIFEPYIQSVIIHLMNFFGDSNEEIRNLSLRATQSAMHNLSAYGVQLLLPILLKGINEQMNWRAKLANIEALGNMAYCSPKQLSTCLPQIVPKLSSTLSDTHPKVRESAYQALSVIGSTIKNPEISEIVLILISSLSDPFYQNQKGLDILLKTQFVHYIDIPALSLIIPIIDYGLRSRDSILKEKASRIVGTILHLIKDPRDLMPYLDILISALIITVTDPLTEVRNIAAKACGCLSKKIQKLAYGLIEQLEVILQSERASSNEKAGAAQGLCEAVWGIGEDYFASRLPDFIERTQSKIWAERDAYIGLFVFFPVLMEEKFEKYIKEVLEYVADSIAEENEATRNKVIRILKICIMKFGMTDTDLLLQPIREGLLNHQWRKRNGAIIIFGDLVETVKKKQKEMDFEEGEELGAKKDRILKTYIPDFDELLMTIHTLKYDLFDQSKIQATNVWKNNVDNTPKIIKRHLSILISKTIQMCVDSEDIKLIASTCIEDFCTKYYESMVQQIFQILLAKAEEFSNNPTLLNGTYLMMRQFLRHATKEHLRKNQDTILELLEIHLLSKEDKLRQSIYGCLKQYLNLLQWPKYQQPVLDRLIQPLTEEIEKLDVDSEEYSCLIRCFNDLVATKSEPVFNYLTPFLLKTPISIAKVDILANNSEFIGPEIYVSENLEMTMIFLFNQLFEAKTKELSDSLQYCINQLSINLDQNYAQNFITDAIDLLKDFKEQDQPLEKSLLILTSFNYFFSYSTFDYQQLITELLEQFVGFLFTDNVECAELINQIMKNLLNIQERELSDQALHELIDLFQMELESNVSLVQNQYIFAFNQLDGIEPYIQLIVQGMAYGMQSTVNDAIELCQILIKYCKKELMSDFIVKMTGVFIRVCNYKLLLGQKGQLLNIIYDIQNESSFSQVITLFSPQLSTTYFRIICDFLSEDKFIKQVIRNFVHLVKFVIRRDYLLNEAWNQLSNAATPLTKYIYTKLIYANLKYNFGVFSPAIIENIFNQITEQFDKVFKFNEIQVKEEEEETNQEAQTNYPKLMISLAKVIGKASNVIQVASLHKFINKKLELLKEDFKGDSETANKQILTCLSILSIYNYHNKPQVFQGKLIMKQILQTFFEQVLKPEQFQCILKFLLKNAQKNNDFTKFLSSEFLEFFQGLLEEWVDEDIIYKQFSELIGMLSEKKQEI